MSGDRNDSRLSRILEEALLEDIGMGDLTTQSVLPPEASGRAELLVKEQGVIAGLEVAGTLLGIVDADLRFEPMVRDGSPVRAGTVAAAVAGRLAALLQCERVLLNIVQRMSGIATLTRQFVDAVAGTQAAITDTRKTAPGLRLLDKLAVRLGGGVNHRFGLDDMVLIKDNHIAAAGGLAPAVRRSLQYLEARGYRGKVEVETKNLAEVREALAQKGIDRIMLDNFSVEMMREAVALVGRRAEVEASGSVTLENVRAIAETGVGFISVGMLTHSVRALDISLKIRP